MSCRSWPTICLPILVPHTEPILSIYLNRTNQNTELNIMKVKLSIVLLCIAAVCSGSTSAKSAEGAKSGDPKMMIIAKLSVKPEKTRDFISAAKEMIEKSNKESGCTFYQLYQDPFNPSKFVFVEEYKNQAAVDAHFATEYFKAFGPKIGDLVTGPADIKVITVASEVLK